MIVSAISSNNFQANNKPTKIIKKLRANKNNSIYTDLKPIKNYSQYIREYANYLKRELL